MTQACVTERIARAAKKWWLWMFADVGLWPVRFTRDVMSFALSGVAAAICELRTGSKGHLLRVGMKHNRWRSWPAGGQSYDQ
jgi:hypothetical protein